MPAEWEQPHTACLILYPHNTGTFRHECRPAQEQVLEVAQAISTAGNEDVILFCKDSQTATKVRNNFGNNKRIVVAVCPSDDTWARDTGPTFIVNNNNNNTLIGLDWDFNAYGGEDEGCYWPCQVDKQVASNMCSFLSQQHQYQRSITTRKVPLVLEGGSIHTDGQGTVLTTSECLLNTNRNPTMSKKEIESLVLEALGCTKMIWLPFGLEGDDDTNGHVDNLACFSQPCHVILSWTDEEEGDAENYKRCRQAAEVLENEVDAQGRTLTVHKLHLPPPMVRVFDFGILPCA